MTNEARGECPACEMPIPLAQTIKRRGKPFDCQACGTNLVLAKPNTIILIAVVAAALLVAKLGGIFAFAVVAALIAVGDWKLARTQVAELRDEA